MALFGRAGLAVGNWIRFYSLRLYGSSSGEGRLPIPSPLRTGVNLSTHSAPIVQPLAAQTSNEQTVSVLSSLHALANTGLVENVGTVSCISAPPIRLIASLYGARWDRALCQFDRFTWRTISTWLYRHKKHGMTTLQNKTRTQWRYLKQRHGKFPPFQGIWQADTLHGPSTSNPMVSGKRP